MESAVTREVGANLVLDSKDILRWNFLTGAEINVSMAKKGYEEVEKLLRGRIVPVIVNMNAKSIDKESRDYYKNNSTKYFSAGIIITESIFSKILGNFFMGFNKPPMPMYLVNNEREAQKVINKLRVK